MNNKKNIIKDFVKEHMNDVIEIYEENGLVCFIRELFIEDESYYCGYVLIQDFRDFDKIEKNLGVFDFLRGGLTFYKFIKYKDFDITSLGFDCAHSTDLLRYGGQPKDIEFVKEQLSNLSKFIKDTYLTKA